MSRIDPQSFEEDKDHMKFYGEAVLYKMISAFIKETRRFMSPHLMTQLRTCYIRKSNLVLVHDLLNLADCFPVGFFDKEKMTEKSKTSVLMNIVGYLSQCEHIILNDICAFVAYCGEKAYFKEINDTINDVSGFLNTGSMVPMFNDNFESNGNNPNESLFINQMDDNTQKNFTKKKKN